MDEGPAHSRCIVYARWMLNERSVGKVLAHSRCFHVGQTGPWVSRAEWVWGLPGLTHCAFAAGVSRSPGSSSATSARIRVSSGNLEKRVPQNWEAVFLSIFTSG